MKSVCHIAVVLLVLFACSCQKKEPGKRMPIKVKTTCLSDNSTSNLSYSGVVEAEKGVSLSFQIPGTIENIPVNVGQRVSAGQLVASINPTAMRNAHDIAKATLSQTQDAYRRMRTLYERGSLPEIQWIEIQSKLSQAEAAERIAAKNFHDCRLTSPFPGVVIAKDMECGQSALPGIPVVKIAQIGRVKVVVSVPEAELNAIVNGATAEIKIPALGDGSFTGVVVEKGITANPVSHTYEVKMVVDNHRGQLMPGMVAKVKMASVNPAAHPKIIPGRAVCIDEHNRNYVWIAKNGKAHRQYVECGSPTDYGVEIISGLTLSDTIIVEGQHKVSEGMEIEIVK